MVVSVSGAIGNLPKIGSRAHVSTYVCAFQFSYTVFHVLRIFVFVVHCSMFKHVHVLSINRVLCLITLLLHNILSISECMI